MTVAEDLRAAKALIDTPEKWAHSSRARKQEGGASLCALDAMYEVCPSGIGGASRALRDAIPDYFRFNPHSALAKLAQFNDAPNTTHADIMALFDRAITTAEAQQP